MTAIMNLLLIFFMFAAGTLGAEEYWSDWFHPADKDSFDAPALSFGPLDRASALASGNYTVVERNASRSPIEAVQILSGKPNYRYTYYYSSAGAPLLRRLEYWNATSLLTASEIIWDYDERGRLVSVGRYVWPFPGQGTSERRLATLKLVTGSNYVVYDYRTGSESAIKAMARKLDRIQDSLTTIERLQKRGLLAKILGR